MEKTFTRPFPRVIRIEPASACNLTCSHCPTGTVKMVRGIMSKATFESVLKSLKAHLDYVKVVVLYHGGEPFLNKNFVDMLGALRNLKSDLFIKTVTNGMLLNEEIIDGILKHKLDLIEFSIDGTSPFESNTIRRKSDFMIIKNNIFNLIEQKKGLNIVKPEINLSTTQFVDPSNYHKDLKAPVPQFLSEYFKEALERKEIITTKSTFAMRWPVMNVESQYDLFFDPYDTEKNYCDHVENTMTIRYNGDVVPCCYDLTTAYRMGNIQENELVDIWNNLKYLDLRKSIAEKKFNNLCNNCNVVRPNVYLVPKRGFLLEKTNLNEIFN